MAHDDFYDFLCRSDEENLLRYQQESKPALDDLYDHVMRWHRNHGHKRFNGYPNAFQWLARMLEGQIQSRALEITISAISDEDSDGITFVFLGRYADRHERYFRALEEVTDTALIDLMVDTEVNALPKPAIEAIAENAQLVRAWALAVTNIREWVATQRAELRAVA